MEMMRRAVMASVLVLVLAGCVNRGSPIAPLVSPTVTPATSILLTRQLKLPTVDPGEACPTTAVAARDVGIADPRGHGPFYVSGTPPRGNFPWNKTGFVLVDGVRGPVLFRGSRIDGIGSLKFSGIPPDHSDVGETLSSGGGVTATFYERMIEPGPQDVFYLYPATSGCYALQVDGPSFEDVIVIIAS
jgi:hypothetical protein